jgi:hypothetical protein
LQDAAYITICYSDYGFALHTVGFEVGARVEMVGAHLAEVGRVVACYVA